MGVEVVVVLEIVVEVSIMFVVFVVSGGKDEVVVVVVKLLEKNEMLFAEVVEILLAICFEKGLLIVFLIGDDDKHFGTIGRGM